MRKIVGVDVGGTYTDLVLVDEEGGEIRIAQVFSTPGDQSIGLMAGQIRLISIERGHDPCEFALIMYGGASEPSSSWS
jgi:N-methylhydantoinase A